MNELMEVAQTELVGLHVLHEYFRLIGDHSAVAGVNALIAGLVLALVEHLPVGGTA